MIFVKTTFRQKDRSGSDLSQDRCESTYNGPFSSREIAEKFAVSIANSTAVFRVSIEELGPAEKGPINVG
jgi:hypothetical protein